MEQASAYSNLSRTTSAKSPPPGTQTLSLQSITSSQSSKSGSPSSSIIDAYGRGRSPSAADRWDSGSSSKASRRPPHKAKRRPRQKVSTLPPEEEEEEEALQSATGTTTATNGAGRTRREKDHLRRSSPTVAENFKFVPGYPPPPNMPPNISQNDLVLASVAASATQFDHPQSPIKDYKEPSTLDDIEQSIEEMNEMNEEMNEGMNEEPSDSPELQNGDTEEGDYVNGQAHILNKSSSSNVRSHVIALPQTAQLRKQASRDQVVRQGEGSQPLSSNPYRQSPPTNPFKFAQPSQATPNGAHYGFNGQQQLQTNLQTGPPPKVPPPPLPQHQQGFQSLPLNPANYMQQADNASRDIFPLYSDGLQGYPPRGQSLARQQQQHQQQQQQQRDVLDQLHEERLQQMNGTQPNGHVFRQRGLQRSGSDAAQRQPYTRFPMPPPEEEEEYDLDSANSDERSGYTSISPAPTSEYWPLSRDAPRVASPEPGQLSEKDQNEQGSLSPRSLRSQNQPHSRNMSQTSQGSQGTYRSYDLINTPRQSLSGASSFGTATIYTSRTVRSSGTGTISTVRSDETNYTTGSGLSAQWYRPPRERNGLGPRVSHAEPVPWELGAEAGELEQVRNAEKRPAFSVFPRTGPPRQDQAFPNGRPRSPLMDEKFPISIKNMQQQDGVSDKKPGSEIDTVTQKSTSSEHSRVGASTPAKELLDCGGGIKKPKNKKPSLFKEMVSEYKNMSSKWYMDPYREPEVTELDWKQDRSQSSMGIRPSTSASSAVMTTHTQPSSLDLETVQEQPENVASPVEVKGPSSDATNEVVHDDRANRQIPNNTKAPPAQIPPPQSSGGQSTKTVLPRQSGETASDKSSSRGSRMSIDGKAKMKAKKEKKPKKPSLFGEMFKEYKEMSNAWYSAPYQSDRPDTRTGSTSTGRP